MPIKEYDTTTYEIALAPMELVWFSKYRKSLMAHAKGDVLEIGSGPGSNLKYYPDTVSCVTALDPSRGMLDRLVRRGEDHGFGPRRCLRTRIGVGEDLPFANGIFDTVVFTLILCTVQDPERTILEAMRVLRSGGTLIAMEHELPRRSLQSAIFKAVAPIWRAPSGCHLNRKTSSILDSKSTLRTIEEGRWGPILGVPFYFRVMKKI